MKMNEITGNLSLLGNSTMSKSQVRYSVIEIGDRVLSDVFVPNGLNNFLEKGLGSTVAIWVDGNDVVWGVHLQDGKTYISNAKIGSISVFSLFVIGVLTLPVFGLGLIILGIAFQLLAQNVSHKKIRAMLPNAISV